MNSNACNLSWYGNHLSVQVASDLVLFRAIPSGFLFFVAYTALGSPSEGFNDVLVFVECRHGCFFQSAESKFSGRVDVLVLVEVIRYHISYIIESTHPGLADFPNIE